MGLAISPFLTPTGTTLGYPNTHFLNPHPTSGSAILSVSRNTPSLPSYSQPLGQHPKLNCHPTTYLYNTAPQDLLPSTYTILIPELLSLEYYFH